MALIQEAGVASPASATAVTLRRPVLDDGRQLHALVAACPPLDPNSLYCNYLQASLLSAGGVVACVEDGRIVGSVTGFPLPDQPETLFVWQVAVHPAMRGTGLGVRMLAWLAAASGATWVETTIAPSNGASQRLFTRFAREHGASMASRPFLDAARHFAETHESECLYRIGPLGEHRPRMNPGRK